MKCLWCVQWVNDGPNESTFRYLVHEHDHYTHLFLAIYRVPISLHFSTAFLGPTQGEALP